MKIVRYALGKHIEYGILEGKQVFGLAGTPYRKLKKSGASHDLAEVRLLAPCLPSKIVALGLNYRSHSEEMKMSIHAAPLIFLKPATSVIGPEDNIIYPPSSKQVDYEGELGVVIKSRASWVSRAEAMDYVLGYTCVNDVTARDLQAIDKQWTRAKSFDTFCPIGPWIETDLDPNHVQVETYLNGQPKQHANTADLVFPVEVLVSFISEAMTLLPGDVIATGTTSGVGPMQPGDTVEIRIEGIGVLRNRIV